MAGIPACARRALQQGHDAGTGSRAGPEQRPSPPAPALDNASAFKLPQRLLDGVGVALEAARELRHTAGAAALQLVDDASRELYRRKGLDSWIAR